MANLSDKVGHNSDYLRLRYCFPRSYADRHAVLRDVLVLCTRAGFAVSRLLVERDPRHMLDDPNQDLTTVANLGESTSVGTNGEVEPGTSGAFNSPPVVMVVLEVQGTQPIADLVASLSEIRGVLSVSAGDANVPTD